MDLHVAYICLVCHIAFNWIKLYFVGCNRMLCGVVVGHDHDDSSQQICSVWQMFVQDEPSHSVPKKTGRQRSVFGLFTAEESYADWNMSGEKATSPCNKFQANIFNKSKCQNCFKSRELHLLNDHDMEQVTLNYTLKHFCVLITDREFDI